VRVVDCLTEDFYLDLNLVGKLGSPEHKGHISGAMTLPFVLLAKNSLPAKPLTTRQIEDIAAETTTSTRSAADGCTSRFG
jgi:hypothetical protein